MDVDQRQLAEERLADQLAEGADNDRLGAGGAQPLERRRRVHVLGLDELDPELGRRHRRRRRLRSAGRGRAAGPVG